MADIDKEKQAAREKLKYEIAEELGLLDKINTDGWRSLTARESGRLGGILAKREKKAHGAAESVEENNEI